MSLNITTHHYPSQQTTTHHYLSLSITTHHCPLIQIIIHHYTSLSITTHHCPSLHITIHHYTSLSITTHHYTSLSITIHHHPSLHITVHYYTSLSITTHHYPSLHITVHHYTLHITKYDFYRFAAIQPRLTSVCLCFCQKVPRFSLAIMLWSLSSQGRQGIRISSIVCNKLRETTEPAFIFTWLHTIILFACHPQILHKHCLQFLLWVKMAPRETENNACAKFGSDEQRTLRYVGVFSRVVNWSTYPLLPFRRPCWLWKLCSMF